MTSYQVFLTFVSRRLAVFSMFELELFGSRFVEVFWSQGRSEWPFISSPVGMATMPSLQMLSREWENTEEIRDRVRKDGVLLWKEAWEDKLKIDIHHTAKNYSVLRPLCQRLQDSNGAVGMHTVPKIQHQFLGNFLVEISNFVLWAWGLQWFRSQKV